MVVPARLALDWPRTAASSADPGKIKCQWPMSIRLAQPSSSISERLVPRSLS